MLWAAIESIGAVLATAHHPLQVVWMRYATHLALLVTVFGPRRGAALVRTTRLRLQVVRGLLMLLMPLCFLATPDKSQLGNVLGVFWVAPLLTMVLSVWLLRERVEVWCWLAAFGGWCGALAMVRPDAGAFGFGTLPALGMALCLSLYLVLTRLLHDESSLINLVFTALCVLVPLSPVMAGVWREPTIRALALMVAIGLLGLGVLYSIDLAAELAPVSAVAPMLYTQPLWVVALAVLLDGVHPGRAALLGGALVMTVCAILFLTAGWRLTGTALSAGSARISTDPPVIPEPIGVQQIKARS
jgi:drug/metabolite transporter (DMT)-like permease